MMKEVLLILILMVLITFADAVLRHIDNTGKTCINGVQYFERTLTPVVNVDGTLRKCEGE
jgi:hypothetical protein